MRKFRAIVQSKIEPEDKNVIWLTYDSLSYYNNGEWVPLLNSPLIGELEEKIQGKVDQNLTTEVTKFKESLPNILKEELGIDSTFTGAIIIIADGSLLSKEGYDKLVTIEERVPVYLREEGRLFKVTSYTTTPDGFFLFTCIDDNTRGDKILVFNTHIRKFEASYNRATGQYIFKRVKDLSVEISDTYILPLTLKVDGEGESFLADDGEYKEIQHIETTILNSILNG